MKSLSKIEWHEMNRIRKEIKNNIQSVTPKQQERFSELFIRSLEFTKS